MHIFKLNQEGAAVLLTVMVISAAVLIMACGAAMIGLGEVDIGFAVSQGDKALSYADSCVEEAIYQLRINSEYAAANYTLPIGTGSCILNISGMGNNRIINVQGKNGNYNKRIRVDLTLSENSPKITNWQEVSD